MRPLPGTVNQKQCIPSFISGSTHPSTKFQCEGHSSWKRSALRKRCPVWTSVSASRFMYLFLPGMWIWCKHQQFWCRGLTEFLKVSAKTFFKFPSVLFTVEFPPKREVLIYVPPPPLPLFEHFCFFLGSEYLVLTNACSPPQLELPRWSKQKFAPANFKDRS